MSAMMSAAKSVPSAAEITQLLHAWQHGDDQAADAFMVELYDVLRQMAAARLRRERKHVAISATELVNEAMLRLFGARAGKLADEKQTDESGPPRAERQFANRSHFLAISALYMRSLLVDHARAAVASGAPEVMMTLTVAAANYPANDIGAKQLVVLDQALRHLKAEDLRASRVMELATFAGMQREEIAEVMELSVPTVDRDLRFARAYLNDALQ
jgi:DNA-directed RNA polymerase specialized sigma24 family protein